MSLLTGWLLKGRDKEVRDSVGGLILSFLNSCPANARLLKSNEFANNVHFASRLFLNVQLEPGSSGATVSCFPKMKNSVQVNLLCRSTQQG